MSSIEKIHLAEKTEGELVSKKQHRKSLNHIFRRKPLFKCAVAIDEMIEYDTYQNQMLHIDAVVKQLTLMWRKEILRKSSPITT